MKTFLILQLRPETEAADDEFEAFLRKGGLDISRTHRIRLDQESLPEGLDLADYAGVIVGGGPGCVSDPAETKNPVEKRIEDEILGLMPEICDRDVPFLGCCYGIGILGHHLAPGIVSKENYGEPVGAVECRLTEAGRADPLIPASKGPSLSRVHASIRLDGWDVHLVDEGSTNGTFVWDEPRRQWIRLAAQQPYVLRPGDQLALGELTATFETSLQQ